MLDYLNLNYLKYKLLKIEFFLRMNFGRDKYGFQIFNLHIVSKAKEKYEYLLRQHYDTYDIWSVGQYFILIE